MAPLDLLAHNGGWDEIVMVGVPVLVFGFLLWVARRRAMGLIEQSESSINEK